MAKIGDFCQRIEAKTVLEMLENILSQVQGRVYRNTGEKFFGENFAYGRSSCFCCLATPHVDSRVSDFKAVQCSVGKQGTTATASINAIILNTADCKQHIYFIIAGRASSFFLVSANCGGLTQIS